LGLDLLACLLCDPELFDQADDVVVTLPTAQELLDLFRDGIATGKSSKDEIVGYLFMRCAERPDLSQHLASCMDRAAHIKSPSETLSLLLKDLSAHQSRHEAQNIRFRLQEARDQGDRALVDKLTQEYLQQLRNRSAGNE
jgi:thymidylate synthase